MNTEKWALLLLVSSVWFLHQPTLTQAGCGCDKPPPTPAAAIPSVAFAGLPVTLFHDSFQVGEVWNVSFQQGDTTIATITSPVVSKRDITDPRGTTNTPQLVVAVPDLPTGPTRIFASTEAASLLVPEESFTVIAKPVVISEQTTSYQVENYMTGVGSDGSLYVSVGGLDKVCKAIEFKALLTDYPLQVENMLVFNSQGFFIDALSGQSAEHFLIEPQQGTTSDRLHYFRHSFEQYCADHQPGGPKEVDPTDSNWHLDGTPHVDYSTLIFAIVGSLQNGSDPQGGNISLALNVETRLGDGTGAWEIERPEEVVILPDDDDDDDDDDDGSDDDDDDDDDD